LASSNVARAAAVFSVAIFFSSSRAPRRIRVLIWRAPSASGLLQFVDQLAIHHRRSRQVRSLFYELTFFHVHGFQDAIRGSPHLRRFRSPLDPSGRANATSRGRTARGYPTRLHGIPVPRSSQERDSQNEQDNRRTTNAPSAAGRHRFFSSCSTWPSHRVIVRSANSRHRGSWVTTTTVSHRRQLDVGEFDRCSFLPGHPETRSAHRLEEWGISGQGPCDCNPLLLTGTEIVGS